MNDDLLKEWIALVLEERRRKPGGPRTDIGALRQLHPIAFTNKVKADVKSNGGDVEAAAKKLGVAKRTLYHYLDDDSELNSVKTGGEEDESRSKSVPV
jgi:hypothetical protein